MLKSFCSSVVLSIIEDVVLGTVDPRVHWGLTLSGPWYGAAWRSWVILLRVWRALGGARSRWPPTPRFRKNRSIYKTGARKRLWRCHRLEIPGEGVARGNPRATRAALLPAQHHCKMRSVCMKWNHVLSGSEAWPGRGQGRKGPTVPEVPPTGLSARACWSRDLGEGRGWPRGPGRTFQTGF